MLAQDIGHGITCIDAQYVDEGMACFYLIESSGEYAVIETGTNHSVPGLLQLMQDRDIQPEQIRYVIPTHVHLDHAGGAGTMMAEFPRATLVIHPRGARHMEQPQRLVEASMAVYGEEVFTKLYGEVLPIAGERIQPAADGDCIQLGERTLELRHTEGHARHHFCVWDAQSRGWFSGDMFGICYPWFRFPEGEYVMPSTTPTQFDPEAYSVSLALLDSHQPESVYLTHYGKIAYSQERYQQLQRQVEHYCEIARRATSEGRSLESDLADYAIESLQAFTQSADRQQFKRWLQFDVQLNAQGLAHWQREQAG